MPGFCLLPLELNAFSPFEDFYDVPLWTMVEYIPGSKCDLRRPFGWCRCPFVSVIQYMRYICESKELQSRWQFVFVASTNDRSFFGLGAGV